MIPYVPGNLVTGPVCGTPGRLVVGNNQGVVEIVVEVVYGRGYREVVIVGAPLCAPHTTHARCTFEKQ